MYFYCLVALTVFACLLPPRVISLPEREGLEPKAEADKLMSDFSFLLANIPPSKWSPVKGVVAKDDNGKVRGRIFRLPDKRGGFVYLVKYLIKASPSRLLDLLWDSTERRSEWATNTETTKIVKKIDPNTMVVYTKTTPQAGGLISSRDFLDLFRLKIDQDGVHQIAWRSTEFPYVPPNQGSNVVRASNFLSGYRFRSSSKFPGFTDLTFLSHGDFKLQLIPAKLVQDLSPKETIKFIQELADTAEGKTSKKGDNGKVFSDALPR